LTQKPSNENKRNVTIKVNQMYTFGKPTTCGEVPDETLSVALSKRFRFAAFDSVGWLAMCNGRFSQRFFFPQRFVEW
jgi:hypothetical protein